MSMFTSEYQGYSFVDGIAVPEQGYEVDFEGWLDASREFDTDIDADDGINVPSDALAAQMLDLEEVEDLF